MIGHRLHQLLEDYKSLDGRNKTLVFVIGLATFAVSLAIIVLVGPHVDLATLLRASVAQVVVAAVIAVLASLSFLYVRSTGETNLVTRVPSEDLRDLIYFDFDKAASIYSQIEGGLLKEKQETTEGTRESRHLARVDLRVIQPELGAVSSERTSVLESKVLHHDLLTRLEQKLEERGLLLNINEAVNSSKPDYSDEGLHNLISKPSFIAAEGWASLEDFNRIDSFISDFPALIELINRSVRSSIEESDAYKALEEAIAETNQEVKQERDNKRKAQLKLRQRQLEQQAEQLLGSAETVDEMPPDWLLEGIRTFITTLIPNRINLRIYPFEQNPRFEVLSKLKPEYFVDSDLENIRFAYGTRPNVHFTILGLITSIPSEKGNIFDPVAELEGQPMGEEDQLESAFRGLLRAFAEFDRFVRFSHYPNVTVYPIAVYQKLDKAVSNEATAIRSDKSNSTED